MEMLEIANWQAPPKGSFHFGFYLFLYSFLSVSFTLCRISLDFRSFIQGPQLTYASSNLGNCNYLTREKTLLLASSTELLLDLVGYLNYNPVPTSTN